MLRSCTVAFFFVSSLAQTYARAVPHPPTTSDDSPTESSSAIATPPASSYTPISKGSSFDDGGEYFPPPPHGEQYYENEGAGGDSTGSIKLSIGAEAGIIVAIVLLGLAIMGSCLWFWMKKRQAMVEGKRVLSTTGHRAPSGQRYCSGGATSPDWAGKSSGEKGAVGLGLTKVAGSKGSNKSHTLPTIAEKEGQLTPIKEEGPEWPWWKRALPRQQQ